METYGYISNMLARCDQATSGYMVKHRRAWRENAHGIPALVEALSKYADAYRKENGQGIGDDGVLGKYWAQGADAIIGLLNGNIDGLDASLTQSILYKIADRDAVDLEDWYA